MSITNSDQMKGEWKQYVGSAKITWGELTHDELLQTEGHVEKLAGLVQERYGVARNEADQQVKAFMESNTY